MDTSYIKSCMEFSEIVNIQYIPTINDLPPNYTTYKALHKIEEDIPTTDEFKAHTTKSIAYSFSNALDLAILESFANDTAETWKSTHPWDNCYADPIGDISRTEIKEGSTPIIYYPLKLWSVIRRSYTLPTNDEELLTILRTITSEEFEANDIGIKWIGSVKLNSINNAYLFKETYATIYIHFSSKQEDKFSTLYTMNFKLIPNYPATHVRILDVS